MVNYEQWTAQELSLCVFIDRATREKKDILSCGTSRLSKSACSLPQAAVDEEFFLDLINLHVR